MKFVNTAKLSLILVCILISFDGCKSEISSKSDTEKQLLDVDETDPLKAELSIDFPIREQKPTDWFQDVSGDCGIEFEYSSGRSSLQFSMVESFGGGIALFDYDQDGDLDIFLTGGGSLSKNLIFSGNQCGMFRNEGGFSFRDVTADVGLDVPIDYSHGVAVGDIDNDQFPDLFVTCYGRSRLFKNLNGKQFEDVSTDMNVIPFGWHTAACFADFNGDSFVDLYVAGYLDWRPSAEEFCTDPKSNLRDVCMPGQFPDAPDLLYLNTGDGHFIARQEESGIRTDGKGLGVVAGDFTQNGNVDLYVANDVNRNFFYENQGNAEFQEKAILSGIAGNEFGIPEGSMGVDAGDLNGDGHLDIFVTNYELEENALYLNYGTGVFSHATVPMGLAGECRPYVGFGTKIADFNLDGASDILIVNGHVTYRNRTSDYLQPTFLYINHQGQRFKKLLEAGPWFDVPHAGRGVAVGDLNNDGALDIVVSEQDRTVSVLKNLQVPKHWIGLELVGNQSGTDAVGTLVQLHEDGRSSQKSIVAGGSYLSHSDCRVLFPLNSNSEQTEIVVKWISGTTQRVGHIRENEYFRIVETASTAALVE